MTNTAQDIKGIIPRVVEFQSRSQNVAEAISPLQGDLSAGRFGEYGAANSPLPTLSESQSSQATRAALLALDDCPGDTEALHVLWKENHPTFESQMQRHLNSADNPVLLQRILSGVVSLSRFYCDEIDDPKAWVARCANLETRRVALQLGR
jgi:hypothetical protein